ncbi:hypothetical protein Tco_1462674, partial [Tanacetum coccineum]
MVRDTLVDIYFRSRISAGKEVDIGLGGGRDKPLRPVDMLLYSWDGGLDVCVDLTGSSPLTQTGLTDFLASHTVVDAAHRKRVKYEAKCAYIRYGFLPFSFSSFGELEKDACAAIGYGFLLFSLSSLGELEADAVTLLKRIRKFSMAQDIGACVAVHIFNKISFAIAKGVMRETLAESSPPLSDVDEEDMNLGERNINQCKRKICDGHYTAVVRVLSSSGVAPYNDVTLEDLKTKHLSSLLPYCHIYLLIIITSLHLQLWLGEYIASAPLTPLVKPCGGIRPIAVGTVWRCLVSKVSAIMIGHSLDGYLDGLQFGVGVAGGSEAILHSMNRLIEACGDDIGLYMLLVDFKNAF